MKILITGGTGFKWRYKTSSKPEFETTVLDEVVERLQRSFNLSTSNS
jgi:hypothetical protein